MPPLQPLTGTLPTPLLATLSWEQIKRCASDITSDCEPTSSLRSAGLTSLQSLSLIGCGVALSMLDDGLGQLRRLLDLELCNGTFIISNPTRTTGEPVTLCGLRDVAPHTTAPSLLLPMAPVAETTQLMCSCRCQWQYNAMQFRLVPAKCTPMFASS